MNGYEFMFLIDPTLDDAAALAVVERVEGIVEGQGAEIVSLQPWERRRLAYPIRGHHEGLYMLCYFDAPPGSIRAIGTRLRLAEGVLRFIVLKSDRKTREADQAADRKRREERAARAVAAEAEAAATAAGEPDQPAAAGAGAPTEGGTRRVAEGTETAAEETSAAADAPQPVSPSNEESR